MAECKDSAFMPVPEYGSCWLESKSLVRLNSLRNKFVRLAVCRALSPQVAQSFILNQLLWKKFTAMRPV